MDIMVDKKIMAVIGCLGNDCGGTKSTMTKSTVTKVRSYYSLWQAGVVSKDVSARHFAVETAGSVSV